MSDIDTTSGQNDSNQQNRAVRGLPITVHAQYVRDLSFENPNAPQSLRQGEGNPEMDININMDARRVEDEEMPNLYEVILKLSAQANRQDYVAFIAEIEYGITVSLQDVPEDKHHPMLMIEVPRMAFPFARQILADATQQGGFPPLYLTPVDFYAMYLNQFGEPESGQGEDSNSDNGGEV